MSSLLQRRSLGFIIYHIHCNIHRCLKSWFGRSSRFTGHIFGWKSFVRIIIILHKAFQCSPIFIARSSHKTSCARLNCLHWFLVWEAFWCLFVRSTSLFSGSLMSVNISDSLASSSSFRFCCFSNFFGSIIVINWVYLYVCMLVDVDAWFCCIVILCIRVFLIDVWLRMVGPGGNLGNSWLTVRDWIIMSSETWHLHMHRRR